MKSRPCTGPPKSSSGLILKEDSWVYQFRHFSDFRAALIKINGGDQGPPNRPKGTEGLLEIPVFDHFEHFLPWKWLVLTILSQIYLGNVDFWPFWAIFTLKMAIFDQFVPLLPWKCLFLTILGHFYLEILAGAPRRGDREQPMRPFAGRQASPPPLWCQRHQRVG